MASLAKLVNSMFSKRPYLRKYGRELLGRYQKSTSALHIDMHVCAHTNYRLKQLKLGTRKELLQSDEVLTSHLIVKMCMLSP